MQSPAEACFLSLKIPVHRTVHLCVLQCSIKRAVSTLGEAGKWAEIFHT